MRFHVLTLFPEMITGAVNNSILKRAAENSLIEVNAVNIRDHAFNKHRSVDDYTYGGGAGMLMQAEPVYQAFSSLQVPQGTRVVYATPQGELFTQKKARELSECGELVFLCGHYEGIDERVIEEIVTDEISIGDYVLTGGELPVLVMMDAIARLIPGVLGNEASAEAESHCNDLLEYPQYSRPPVWHDRMVPEILMGGDHARVDEWRLFESIRRTRQRRPDMYARYRERTLREEEALKPKKRKLTRFIGELESEDGDGGQEP